MTRLDILVDAIITTVSLDDLVLSADRTWGVVALRLVDELTGRPPKGAIRLISSNPALTPQIAEDGLVGLVGIPTRVFPGLKTHPYTVDLTIQVTGYVDRKLTVTWPIDSTFPSNFNPLILPDLILHHLPIIFKGRTVRVVNGNIQVAPAVNVRISGVWRTIPPANATIPPNAPKLVYLAQPLYADRTHTSSSLRQRDLTVIAGFDKHLLDACSIGSTMLRLSNRQGLTPGGTLLIDGDNPGQEEFLSIQTIQGGSTPDQIARITLQSPTVISHRQNALVQPTAPVGSLGANNVFAQDGIRGDTTIFLNSLSGLSSARQVRVAGGLANEFHDIQIYQAQSDANGYYRLSPLSRVAQVELEARDGTQTIKTVICPDYGQKENFVDFVFP